LARNFYRDPSKYIKIIGVTGTNGKTTITYLLEDIFKNANFKTGVIGTINYRVGENVMDSEQRTTPDPLTLNKLLRDMIEQSIPYCFVEVSSHGLEQGRVEDIKFAGGVFTNLTHEHLDYHKTVENYLKAKLKLFENLSQDSYAVINNDSRYRDELISRVDAKIITYGIEKESDVMAKDLRLDLNGVRCRIHAEDDVIDIKTSLIGKHNVYNILAAASVAMEEGLGPDRIKNGIMRFSGVPGRLERVECGQDFGVFIDYAHTEDALRNVLGTLRQITKKKIILVFGCGGDRDRTKRPEMGRTAAELANFTIITSDNPRSEDPVKIAKEIEEGFVGMSSKYIVVPDRYEAIKRALSAADEDALVLIAGKGHEKNQIFSNHTVPFDDKKIASQILKSL